MYPNTVIILLLPFAFWAKVEGESIFDDLDSCDPALEARITENDRVALPKDMKEKMVEHTPWIVHFTNYKETEKVVGTKFLDKEILITKLTENGQEDTPDSVNVDWNTLLEGGESGGLKLQVWNFDEETLVFLYYLCKPVGGKEGGKNPRFGVAVAYGNRVGAIPEEALYELEDVNEHIKEKFKVTVHLKQYDMDEV